eukprot:3812050-Prymnesium_polylepis.1
MAARLPEVVVRQDGGCRSNCAARRSSAPGRWRRSAASQSTARSSPGSGRTCCGECTACGGSSTTACSPNTSGR